MRSALNVLPKLPINLPEGLIRRGSGKITHCDLKVLSYYLGGVQTTKVDRDRY
jgi:transposase-like protein